MILLGKHSSISPRRQLLWRAIRYSNTSQKKNIWPFLFSFAFKCSWNFESLIYNLRILQSVPTVQKSHCTFNSKQNSILISENFSTFLWLLSFNFWHMWLCFDFKKYRAFFKTIYFFGKMKTSWIIWSGFLLIVDTERRLIFLIWNSRTSISWRETKTFCN